MNALASQGRSRAYYDEFSRSYEQHRARGYHALIDDLEVEAAAPYCEGARVLEAGCGTGLILQRLARPALHAVGLDLSAGMLGSAARRELAVTQGSVDELPFADESFDTVVSFKVLAHVPTIVPTIRELARVTRRGGHLLLEFYNRHSLRTLIKVLKHPSRIGGRFNDEDVFTRFDTLEQIRGYLPPDLELVGHRGVRVFTPIAQVHQVPGLGALLGAAERWAAGAPLLSRLGGFLIVILRKR
jgi:ubiquinone/menaquinone biosynthesis C-methylase UbiE